MAHLWLHSTAGWSVFPLIAEAVVLGAVPEPAARACLPTESLAGRVMVRRVPVDDLAGAAWLLLAPPACPVWVNGQAVRVGARMLAHKDEVRVWGAAAPVFFSTEELAQVTAFPAGPRPANCPRCRQVIIPGTPAVRCPRCKIWHHQDPVAKRACFTYAPVCACCDRPTALDGCYTWMPEEIAT